MSLTESEEFKRDCEARFYVAEFYKRLEMEGKLHAWRWWHDTLDDIARRRGKPAVDALRARMNQKRRPAL